MKILLAEDDSSISVVIKLALERLGGHTVQVVTDGHAAVTAALEKDFDLVLLDGMMPGRDGFSVCREVKKTKPQINIIFVSAKSQESDIRDGIESGALGYIQKPFDPKTICSVIDDIMKQRGARAA